MPHDAPRPAQVVGWQQAPPVQNSPPPQVPQSSSPPQLSVMRPQVASASLQSSTLSPGTHVHWFAVTVPQFFPRRVQNAALVSDVHVAPPPNIWISA